MSDFLEKMKSIFIVQSDDTGGQKPIDSPESAQQTDANTPASNTSESMTESGINGTNSEEFYKILFDALNKNNQTGFDYIEFRKALMNLANIIPDEQNRFLSAFAGAQAAGATSTGLISSASKYLTILESEQQNFQNAVTAQWDKQVESKKNEITQLTQSIESKKVELAKIQKEIEENNASVTSLNKEIDTAKTKIETTKANFDFTYKNLTNQIKSDVDRIKTYIK